MRPSEFRAHLAALDGQTLDQVERRFQYRDKRLDTENTVLVGAEADAYFPSDSPAPREVEKPHEPTTPPAMAEAVAAVSAKNTGAALSKSDGEPPARPVLRVDQVAFGTAVFREFNKGKRSTLGIAHPGWGKTITMVAIAERVVRDSGKSVLIMHHRGELGSQIVATARRYGLTVGREEAEEKIDHAARPQIVVASVQSLVRRLPRYDSNAIPLVIVDEAQHAFAATYRKVLAHFPKAKVLGVTGTADRGDGEPLGAVFETIAYRVELAEGIASGRHVPVEVVQATIEALDTSNIKTKSGELDPSALGLELLNDGPRHAVAKALADLHEGRQTIVFNPDRKFNQALAELLPEYGVSAAWIDATLPKDERARRVAAYERGEIRMLCNIGILTEGYDNPATSCVAMVRMPASRGLFVQMMCRGGRPAPNKENMLLIHFQAETLGKAKLTAPADVLDGCSWKRRKDYGNEKKEAAEKAAREKEAAYLREIHQIGLHYAVSRYPLLDIFKAAHGHGVGCGTEASPKQQETLKKLGFALKDRPLTRDEAQLCFEIMENRTRAGLMTVKQAKKLCPHGYPDNLLRPEADALMNELAANGWKPPRHWHTSAA